MAAKQPEDETAGPFIVWSDMGYDGWHPTSYKTIEEAVLRLQSDGYPKVLTRPLKYEVKVTVVGEE
jgi:hypothetical protein